jgi:anaerobic selenocysteine-containing dehydrogenase
MLHVIITEGLHDRAFLALHASGLDGLVEAVRPFTPQLAADHAGIDASDIVAAARSFARADYAFAIAGTGPNMAQSGTLLEYLLLCLQTVCGHWAKPGEPIANPGTLKPAGVFRAQSTGPWPVVDVGETMRVHGLTTSAAGPPTGALADEILLDGPGKVRALICVGGNPAVSWPDQARAVAALRQLELLVQIDPFMSQTAQLAHYVIAPTIAVERPSTSQFAADHAGGGFGRASAYGQYVPAAVTPPAGSDVIDEWEFFYGLATRMGLPLALAPMMTYRSRVPGAAETCITEGPKPSLDDLLAIVTSGSRIGLDEVRRHRHGRAFPDDSIVVQPTADGWTARFDIGNADMMGDLAALITTNTSHTIEQPGPFSLISRRMMHVYNSSFNAPSTHRGRPYNPAFLHPEDLHEIGIEAGDDVVITSDVGRIIAVAETDASVRRGCVSMAHAFGDIRVGGDGDSDDDPRVTGSSTARLLSVDGPFDRYSGQPRMSGIAVAVSPARSTA